MRTYRFNAEGLELFLQTTASTASTAHLLRRVARARERRCRSGAGLSRLFRTPDLGRWSSREESRPHPRLPTPETTKRPPEGERIVNDDSRHHTVGCSKNSMGSGNTGAFSAPGIRFPPRPSEFSSFHRAALLPPARGSDVGPGPAAQPECSTPAASLSACERSARRE